MDNKTLIQLTMIAITFLLMVVIIISSNPIPQNLSLCDMYELETNVTMRVISDSTGAVTEINLNGVWYDRDQVHLSCMAKYLE